MDTNTLTTIITATGAVIATITPIAIAIIHQVRRSESVSESLEQRQQKQIEKVAQAEPENIQEIAASQLAIISNFNESVLRQAQQSFTFALAATLIGLVFFIAAIGFLIVTKSQNISNTSLISGALVEVIAGINFYLYGRASNQFSTFHQRLDRIQHFLLANSICESLTGDTKDHTRSEIIQMIVKSVVHIDKEKSK